MAIFKHSAAHLAIVIILIISVIPIHSSSLLNTDKASPFPVIYNTNYMAAHTTGMEPTRTVYYLGSNLSVPANSTYTFNGYGVLAESLSLPSINISVHGKFELLNSTFGILNATYNTVDAINIILHAGSSLEQFHWTQTSGSWPDSRTDGQQEIHTNHADGPARKENCS